VHFSGGEPTPLAALPGRHPLLRAKWIYVGAGATNGIEIRQEPGILAGRRPKRGAPTPTCNSTASATQPTRIAKSGNLFDVKLAGD